MTGRSNPLPGMTGLGSAALPGLISPDAIGASQSWRPYVGAWNPSDKDAAVTLSVINTVNTASSVASSTKQARAAIALSGMVAWCVYLSAAASTSMVGVGNASASLSQFPGQNSDSYGYFGADGHWYFNNVDTAFGSAMSNGQYLMFAYNEYLFGGSLFVGREGTWIGGANPLTGANPKVIGLRTGLWFPMGVSADRNEVGQILPLQL